VQRAIAASRSGTQCIRWSKRITHRPRTQLAASVQPPVERLRTRVLNDELAADFH
jgi:hypothetical protein